MSVKMMPVSPRQRVQNHSMIKQVFRRMVGHAIKLGLSPFLIMALTSCDSREENELILNLDVIVQCDRERPAARVSNDNAPRNKIIARDIPGIRVPVDAHYSAWSTEVQTPNGPVFCVPVVTNGSIGAMRPSQ